MKFIPDVEAGLWLSDFSPDVDSFDWDVGNRAKNEKHGVHSEEIESIFYAEKFVFFGRIVEPAHKEWRGLILGRSGENRSLALVFTRRGNKLRPISCRSMRPGERRLYEASIQEHS